jgi:serine O-acetyltransferase
MTFSQLFYLIRWDMRINHGVSFDSLRAKFLLIEIRIEQFVYRNFYRGSNPLSIVWFLCRFLGSIFQWFLCNSNIPGSTTIGRGLRLPHPQNIIMAAFADFGEFCTVYHNVSIAWNGFKPTVPHSPKIGDRVLVGTNAIILGDITIGSDVIIGAGTVVYCSIPDYSRVTSTTLEVKSRFPSDLAVEPGSKQHIRDPYGIWR